MRNILVPLLTGVALLFPAAGAIPAASAQSSTVSAPAPTAPGAAIAPFAGPWAGRTDPGAQRERGATLLIEPFAGGEFRITWTNFEADTSASGGVARRDRSLLFRPSRAPGVWTADTAGDPFDLLGAWARIDGRALVIEMVALQPDGRLERQSYRRTLTGDGLGLTYRRWLDQSLDRQLDASFLRL